MRKEEEEKARGRAGVKCCAFHVFFYSLFAFIFLHFHSPFMNIEEMLASEQITPKKGWKSNKINKSRRKKLDLLLNGCVYFSSSSSSSSLFLLLYDAHFVRANQTQTDRERDGERKD